MDALLLTGTTESSDPRPDTDDSGSGAAESDKSSETHPPPTPAVTPEPANPPPDKLMLNSALASAAGALVGALLLRYIWRRWFRNDNGE